MRERRPRARLRGWGGVGAMAVVCALALAFALLVTRARGDAGPGPGTGGPGLTRAVQTKADQGCRTPEMKAAPEKQTLSPSGADGRTIDAIKRHGKLIVGVDQNSYRWGYRDPNSAGTGDLEGFDIDLVHRIAEDILGDANAVQFRAIPTDQRIPAIQEGRVDMVVRTMTINCDRLGEVAFSAPYFKTGQQVLAPRTSKITGYDGSLAHQRICTAKGSTANTKLVGDQQTGGLVPTADLRLTVPNQLDCLVRLQLGDADAVVTDGALAASQAAQDPTVTLKGAPFTTEYYGVAMRKDADDLVRRVNRILVEYRQDKANGWQASYNRWLAATLGESSAASEPPPPTYLRKS